MQVASTTAAPAHELEMEVFRAGDYGERGAYTEADLDALAQDYDPARLEAPLTLDHAQSGPAYGWVRALRREGDRLLATLAGVPAAAKELLQQGAYKRRSIELVRAHAATGRPYLRAVSLLGAAAPAVEGLREVRFSAAAAMTTESAAPAAGETAEGIIAIEPVAEAAVEPAPPPVPPPASEGQPVPHSAEVVSFAALAREGIVLSAEEAGALDKIAGSAGADSAAWMREFLRRRCAKVPAGFSFAEGGAGPPLAEGVVAFGHWHSPAAEGAPHAGAWGAGGSAPARVSAASVRLHQAAAALCAAQPGLSYADALRSAARC